MPVVTLPDGSHRSFAESVTVHDVAADIGAGLAKAAIAGRVNGKLVDTSFPIEEDAELAIVTERDEDGVDIIRHSTAHLLAMAVKELFPSAQVTIGPVVDNGFYYDFKFDRPFTNEDLSRIEKRMEELAKQDIPVSRSVMSRDEAVRLFDGWVRNTRFASLRIFPARRIYPSTARVTLSICVVALTCPTPASSRPSS